VSEKTRLHSSQSVTQNSCDVKMNLQFVCKTTSHCPFRLRRCFVILLACTTARDVLF